MLAVNARGIECRIAIPEGRPTNGANEERSPGCAGSASARRFLFFSERIALSFDLTKKRTGETHKHAYTKASPPSFDGSGDKIRHPILRVLKIRMEEKQVEDLVAGGICCNNVT